MKKTQSVLMLTINLLIEMLERQQEVQHEKLSDYEKYPKLESQQKGEILGFIKGLDYSLMVCKTQRDMVEMAEDLTGSREC